MSGAAGLPAWYWERGLHDAQLLSAELQDDTLTLRLDSRSALFDNTVSQITFLGARLKTPLPTPDRQTNVYWLGDTLTALPFDQWKLEISLQTLARRNKTINTTPPSSPAPIPKKIPQAAVWEPYGGLFASYSFSSVTCSPSAFACSACSGF